MTDCSALRNNHHQTEDSPLPEGVANLRPAGEMGWSRELGEQNPKLRRGLSSQGSGNRTRDATPLRIQRCSCCHQDLWPDAFSASVKEVWIYASQFPGILDLPVVLILNRHPWLARSRIYAPTRQESRREKDRVSVDKPY